jgi:hypothetical protein
MYPTHEGLWYAIFRMSIKGNSRIYSYLRENYVRSKAHNEKIKKALTGNRYQMSGGRRFQGLD